MEKIRIDLKYFQQLLESLDTTDDKNFELYNIGKKIIRNFVGSKKVQVDLSEREFVMLSEAANELNLTFSEYCSMLLEDYIKKEKKRLDS